MEFFEQQTKEILSTNLDWFLWHGFRTFDNVQYYIMYIFKVGPHYAYFPFCVLCVFREQGEHTQNTKREIRVVWSDLEDVHNISFHETTSVKNAYTLFTRLHKNVKSPNLKRETCIVWTDLKELIIINKLCLVILLSWFDH